MLKSKVFQKYLILGICLTSIFFLIAFMTNHFMIEAERESDRQQMRQERVAKHKTDIKKGKFRRAPHRNFREGRPTGPPPKHIRDKKPKHLIMIIALQMLAVIAAVAITIITIFLHFKGRTHEIEKVLQQIKEGDLKARMPVTENSDEFGFSMGKFNLMADEIEALINRLRNTEATRRVLLSELAHDIRTPLASVLNLIEILTGEKGDELDKEKKKEILNMSHKEIKYISQLVEDLLFLGRIEEPSYQKKDKSIDLLGPLNEAILSLKKRYPAITEEIISDGINNNYVMDPLLAHRLFRNVLENAYSFAEGKVLIKLIHHNEALEIQVYDDGPGIGNSRLKDFGNKKFSRQEIHSKSGEKRISIGLGSVIMNSIVKSYHGELSIQNNQNESLGPKGALVKIILPK